MDREKAAYEAMPETEQLFEIARIGVCLAKETGRLIKSQKTGNAHIFLANELYYVDFNSERYYQEASHKFIGRIARTGYQMWSMRLAEPYWVNAIDTEDGYRAMYRFEWTDREVLRSDKWLKARARQASLSEDENNEAEDGLQVHPSFLHAINQYQYVSKADAEELIFLMQEFTDKTKSVKGAIKAQ